MDMNFQDIIELSSTEHKHLDIAVPQFQTVLI